MRNVLFAFTGLVFLCLQQATAQNTSPYWSLAGNSNATSSSKLGNTTAIPLRLLTNNTTRMYISPSAGYVGIGTTSPENKLHVFKGSAGSVTGFSAAPLIVENSANSYINILAPEASATGVLFGKPSSNVSGSIIYNDVSHNTNGFDFRTNGNITQMVLSNAGKLGLGTLAPRAKLHVLAGSAGSGTTYSNGPLIVENSFDCYLNLIAPTANETGILFGKTGSYGDGAITYNNTANPNGLQFRTNGGTTQMVLTSKGNLGIGTTAPVYPLHVLTSTSIRGINVINSYTDYTGYEDPVGVYATSVNGIGVSAVGGFRGVEGEAKAGNSINTATGVFGFAQGDAGSYLYGVGGAASGGTHAYGVYGSAAGSSSFNAAGYFDGAVWANSYNTISDRKFKQDIVPLEHALEQVLKLKPSAYRFKGSEYKSMHLPEGRQIGLVADEVKAVFPELVHPAVHPAEYDKEDRQKIITPEVKYEGINYQGLIPVLIASIQEQEAANKALKEEVAALRQMVLDIKNGTNTVTGMGVLLQAIPNPAASSVRISYSLPAGAANAQLLVTDAVGKTIKAISLNGSGNVEVNTTSLSSGVYNYSLFIDNKIVETKKLVVAR